MVLMLIRIQISILMQIRDKIRDPDSIKMMPAHSHADPTQVSRLFFTFSPSSANLNWFIFLISVKYVTIRHNHNYKYFGQIIEIMYEKV
jgi:hypothetical protein